MRKVLLSIALVILMPAAAMAQSPNGLGKAPFASYFKGDIDSINLYNGNLMLDLPLFSRQGREMSTGLRLIYNAQGWTSTATMFADVGSYQGGWKVTNPIGVVLGDPYLADCDYSTWPEPGATGVYNIDVIWVDGTGAVHTFESATIRIDPWNGGCDEFSWTQWNLTGGQWVLSTGTDGLWAFIGLNGDLSIHMQDGNTIAPGAQLESVNGNYAGMTTTGSGTQILADNLGRTIGIAVYSETGGTYTEYTINDSSGNPQVYRLHYANHSVFNPIEEASDSIAVLTSIDLPDGHGSYHFDYDHDQGFLTKVTFPSGGYITYSYFGGNTDHDKDHNYVIDRRVSPDGSTPTKWWSYERSSGPPRVVTETRPDDTVIKHTFDGSGYETETRWLASATATVPAKIVETTYPSPAVPFPYEIVTTVGNVKQKQTLVWANSRLSTTTQSDWYPATGSVANLTKTEYTYVTCAVLPCNLDFPSVVELKKWNGGSYVTTGKTEFVYNEYSTYPLVTRTGVSNHHTPIYTRWNVTSVNHYYDSTHYVSEHFQYDELGNVVQHIDVRGKTTDFDFTDNYDGTTGNLNSYAYPKLLTNAEGHEVEILYNFDTGLPVSTTDPRSLVTTITYDALDRPLVRTEPNGRTVTVTYDDGTTPKVTEVSTVSTGVTRKTETTFDKAYRPIQSKDFDSAGDVFTYTEYDFNGRVKKVSAPYRSGSGSVAWTEMTYDEVDRAVTIKNPDTSTVTVAYVDNTVTTTNEAGQQRKETRNGLGQLIQVDEPNPTLSSPKTTTYGYYVFGPLASVTQGSQSRSFTVDWLGRMSEDVHPETGTTTYTFDEAGLITSRTQPRSSTTSVTSTYTYDDVGRLLTTSYDDGTSTVTRAYDASGYAGLLTSVTDGLGSITYTYKTDSNLLASETRAFTSVSPTSFVSSYNYDKEGKMTSVTYPSGREVAWAYTPITGGGYTTGRSGTVVDNATSKTVLTVEGDNAAGQVLQQTLGNNAQENRTFNSRLQLTGIAATKSSVSLLDLTYGYGTNDTGRILSRTDGVQPEHSVNYNYDSLHRLSSVAGTDTNWGITWGFDDWGNRTSQTPTGLATSRVGSITAGYSNNKNTSWTYDWAGNVTNDSSHSYTYDGENRIVQVDSSANQYGYDGYGRRVKRVSGGVTTYYLYGQAGLMSEFSTVNSGTQASSSGDKLEYRVSEQTGTPVLLMNSSGVVVENNRVLPYGELWATPAYSTNESNFTTYERDSESQKDYAISRYYSFQNGRFMSTDPGHVGASTGNPQSWNAYAYVHNDPINFVDPDGLFEGPQLPPCGKNVPKPCKQPPSGGGTPPDPCTDVEIGKPCGPSGPGGGETGGPVPGGPGTHPLPPQRPPVTPCKPTGGFFSWLPHGAGASAGANGDLGAGVAGVSLAVSGGGGTFYDENTGFSEGHFISRGQTAYFYENVKGKPQQNQPRTLGAYVGGGVSGFLTNARSVRQLEGPFDTANVNVGFGPAKFSFSLAYSGGIWQVSFGPPVAGDGAGASVSFYTTETKTQKVGCQ